MRIFFVRPHPVIPESYAGTQITLHWLCRRLKANGHEIALAAPTRIAPRMPPKLDHECGYPVFRAINVLEAARAATANVQPEVVVVTQAGHWMESLPPAVLNAPLVLYEHEISNALARVSPKIKARASFVANSAVTSAHLAKTFGLQSTIIPPIFGVEQYAGVERHGDNVLFVSLQRRKGFDVALEIAKARPDAKFIFIETWNIDEARTQMLRNLVDEIPNITRLPNQKGLAHILPQLKLLLMPSRGEESWGRTVTELQICGIPVLGSSRGNLPVTIGPGGVTLDPDEPIELWLEAFDRIMDDASVYEDLCSKARAYGRLFVERVEKAYQNFENVLRAAVAKHQT